MRVLLDTNVIIHREAARVVSEEIGVLFYWLDRMNCEKCVHPLTVDEIEKHADPQVVHSFRIKIDSYHILKTEAPLDQEIIDRIGKDDKTENDSNDTRLLNELHKSRVDFIITEDRGIHRKASALGLSDRVYTIDSFLEKVVSENPDLVDYNVLSVKKEYFGNVDLDDPFFDDLKNDYVGFEKWFNRKADSVAYVCKEQEKTLAFLYVKSEGPEENYSDISPVLSSKKRLKIGTFKVALNGYKLGERFLKIVFDNAIRLKVDEIYVTIFRKRPGQERLIELLENWGFYCHGTKKTASGIEEVFIRDFSQGFDPQNPRRTYPYIRTSGNSFIVPIYPEYHTELFPDSILRTESPTDFTENEPHRNAISKVYISRSIERDLNCGDLIVFYRTGGYYRGVVSTIGTVENVITDIPDEKSFIRLCRKRSVFTDEKLSEWWHYKPNLRPFIVNFLYALSFPKRPNLKRLIELGVIPSVNDAPRGFRRLSKTQLLSILEEAQVDGSYIVD